MWWMLALGAAVVLLGAPSTDHSRPHPGPSWFDIVATLEPTGRRARRQRR